MGQARKLPPLASCISWGSNSFFVAWKRFMRTENSFWRKSGELTGFHARWSLWQQIEIRYHLSV